MINMANKAKYIILVNVVVGVFLMVGACVGLGRDVEIVCVGTGANEFITLVGAVVDGIITGVVVRASGAIGGAKFKIL